MITTYECIIDQNDSKLLLPEDCKILEVNFQGDDLCLWAYIDTNNKLVERHFKVFETGHEMPYQMGICFNFIGTTFMHNGLVLHVFERTLL